MTHQRNKISQREQEQAKQQSSQQQDKLEFKDAEEAIRFDSTRTPVPPQIQQRIKDSVAQEPAPAKTWWSRLFSK